MDNPIFVPKSDVKIAPLRLLFTNHMDAWGMTLIVCLLAQIIHDRVTLRHMLLTVGLVVGYWFAFGLNDYFDAPFDAVDAEKSAVNYFTHTSFPKSTILVVALVIACFLLALFAQFGQVGILILGLALFISWAYSAPPLRIKTRPFFDLFTHAFFVETFPYAVMLLLMSVTPTRLDWVLLALFFCASFAAQLEQQLRDYAVDVLEGENFTIKMGKHVSSGLLKGATVLIFSIYLTAVFTRVLPVYLAVYGPIGLIGLLRRFVKTKRSESVVNVTIFIALCYTVSLLVWRL